MERRARSKKFELRISKRELPAAADELHAKRE